MPKSEGVGVARQRRGRGRPAMLPDAIEGYIVEICRDLAVQVKRMRQLQDQADELRVVVREWASPSKLGHGAATRGGRC
jgi:hypothetical protein